MRFNNYIVNVYHEVDIESHSSRLSWNPVPLAPKIVVLWKRCRYLRFTQTNISTRFKDGRDITELIQDLVCDSDAVWNVKPLRVFF